MIRLGMIGFGGFGWTMRKIFPQAPDNKRIQIVAGADNRLALCPDRVQQLKDNGAEVFEDAFEMFDKMQGRCDAVYIATSIHSHMPLAIAAVKAGYHVYLEKPPAATIQEVNTMREAVAQSGKICMVGFQRIHSEPLQWVKERIVAGKLGKLIKLSARACWPRPNRYYSRNEWAGKLRAGDKWILDGPATNALSHETNNLMFLASDKAGEYATPAAVRAELYAAGPVESHNVAAIETQTAEGPKTYFIASHATQNETCVSIVVEGEKGTARLGKDQGGARIDYNDGTSEELDTEDTGKLGMMVNFAEAILANDPKIIRCDLEDTRNVIMSLNGAHESSRKIHRIGDDHYQRVDEGTEMARTVVEGMDEMIETAAAQGCLFSDLSPVPPWATRTEPFDMTGYAEFPQQFRCE